MNITSIIANGRNHEMTRIEGCWSILYMLECQCEFMIDLIILHFVEQTQYELTSPAIIKSV